MKPTNARLRLTFALAALLCAGLLAPGVSRAAAAATPPPPAVALTAADAQAWLDGLMPTALKTAQVPGAVVVLVKDGQVLAQKGYGFADYERRKPVDPRSTLFRPGSTSKLFTWTAVMQLVEQGKLDLDADVNRYLDFTIPARNGVALTLRHIMTHRTGFEETAKDLLAFGDKLNPLGAVLKAYVPPQMFDPGTTPAYSNYATAVAGYIVERVSGQPFADYIDQHLLRPLEMRNSTFQQPLPPGLREQMSQGYLTQDKPGRGFEMIDMAPAGALSASGEDMAHFMVAHLQQGRWGEARILKPETARLMHSTTTRSFPALNGMVLGFYEQNINGHRVIAHGGDTNYFHSDLFLFLDDQIGLFISVNAGGKDNQGQQLRDRLFQGFADRYLPGTETTARVDAATAQAHAAAMAGRYNVSRRADSTFLSLISLLSPMQVTANPDASIAFAFGGLSKRFVETEPWLWHEVNGHDMVQAVVKDGRVERWSTDSIAFAFSFAPLTGLAGAGLALPLAVAALGLLAVAVIGWPVSALVRRHFKAPSGLAGPRLASDRLVRVAALLACAAVGLWTWTFVELEDYVGGLDALLHAAQLVSLLAFAGGLAAALWHAALTWRAGAGTWPRCAALALVVAFGYLLWTAATYHLIGFSSHY